MQVTYLDKDKNSGNPVQQTFRDADANELKNAVNSKADAEVLTSPQTTDHTLALTDQHKAVETDSANPNTVTVPLNSVVAFPVGALVPVIQKGLGPTTIAGAVGVTLRSKNSNRVIAAQNTMIGLYQRAADDWYIIGDLIAAALPKLATPSITFGTVTSTSIIVNWAAISGANNFILKRNTSNTLVGATQIFSGAGTTYTDTSLTASTTYYYFLIAQDTTAAHTDSDAGTASQATSAASDVDADAYLTAVTTAGRTVSAPERAAVTSFVTSLKSAGVWSKLVVSNLLTWNNANASKINLKTPGTHNLANVPAFAQAPDGITPDGSYVYVDDANADAYLLQNDVHIGAYPQTAVIVNQSEALVGCTSGAGAIALHIAYYNTGTQLFAENNIAQGVSATFVAPAAAFDINSRLAADHSSFYRNGVKQFDDATASVGVPAALLSWGNMLNEFNTGGWPSTRKFWYGTAGRGLTDQQVADYNTAVHALKTALGI